MPANARSFTFNTSALPSTSLGAALKPHCPPPPSLFPFTQVKEALQNGIAVASRVLSATERLTGQLWPADPSHRWNGTIVRHPGLQELADRLEEILGLRAVHEQMLGLLSEQEKADYRTQEAFGVFSQLDVLHCSAFTAPLWRAAVAEYERAMEPVQAVVGSKLREAIADMQTNAQSLQGEFVKYRELLQRPAVARTLVSEREILLGQLREEAASLQQEYNRVASGETLTSGAHPGRNVPVVVRTLMWCRQLEARLEDVASTAEVMLSDLDGSDTLVRSARDLREEAQTFALEQFNDWARDMESRLQDEDFMLQTTGRLMHFEQSDGQLQVHYSDRLMTMLREVRQLTALGYSVSSTIKAAANTARAFYRHAVILKQVAHFYNSIGDQILDSQFLMLEKHARHLEGVIKQPQQGGQAVRWDSPEALDNFVQRLQEAAELLTKENRKLRKIHDVFAERTIALINVDLLRQQQQWKDGLGFFRSTCATLVSQGIPDESLRPWKTHWDFQLYKALEHQYQLGLENLNEMLPELRIDLVFANRQLTFRPPLEEVRAKYYRDLKHFLVIPERFGGVADGSLYRTIIKRNAGGFATIYKKAEHLFHRLAKGASQFKDWVALGAVDVEALASEHLTEVSPAGSTNWVCLPFWRSLASWLYFVRSLTVVNPPTPSSTVIYLGCRLGGQLSGGQSKGTRG
jgi:dynein heavy chain 2